MYGGRWVAVLAALLHAAQPAAAGGACRRQGGRAYGTNIPQPAVARQLRRGRPRRPRSPIYRTIITAGEAVQRSMDGRSTGRGRRMIPAAATADANYGSRGGRCRLDHPLAARDDRALGPNTLMCVSGSRAESRLGPRNAPRRARPAAGHHRNRPTRWRRCRRTTALSAGLPAVLREEHPGDEAFRRISSSDLPPASVARYLMRSSRRMGKAPHRPRTPGGGREAKAVLRRPPLRLTVPSATRRDRLGRWNRSEIRREPTEPRRRASYPQLRLALRRWAPPLASATMLGSGTLLPSRGRC